MLNKDSRRESTMLFDTGTLVNKLVVKYVFCESTNTCDNPCLKSTEMIQLVEINYISEESTCTLMLKGHNRRMRKQSYNWINIAVLGCPL